MDKFLNWFMSIDDCLLIKTIQVYKVYKVVFVFTIDAFNEKNIVPFLSDCKRERLSCKWWSDTLHYEPYEVSLIFVLNFQRQAIQTFSGSFLEFVQRFLVIWCALPKTRRRNVLQIPFCYKYAIVVMPLFKNVWWTVVPNLIICFQLK